MAGLFDSTVLDGVELANRFVRSATNEGMADGEGKCTQQLTDFLVELAKGQVGLVITGHAYVSKEGQASNGQSGIYSDVHVEGFCDLTESVHAAGGKVVVQLAHAGGQADEATTGAESIGPSVIANAQSKECRAMTAEDIGRVVEAFGEAARRAKESSFDGVQIHAAHGYLLSEFLSGFYNKRTDEYGGSIENRARIVLEVLGAIRERVGKDYHVQIKMNSEDFLENGLTVDEMLAVAGMLEDAGIGAIELSGGALGSPPEFSPVRMEKKRGRDWEVFYRDAAKRFKEKINVPLILVGGVRSFDIAEGLIADGVCDYVSLCRPLIREPGLIKRWADGDRGRAMCVSDNACFMPIMKGEALYCVTEERQKKRTTNGHELI